MIFIILCLFRLANNYLPGVYRRHSRGNVLVRYLSGFPDTPRSAHDAAKRYLYILDCARLWPS